MRRTFHAGVCIGHRPLTVCYASASAPICRSRRHDAIKGSHQYRGRNTECLRGRHWRVTRCQPLRSHLLALTRIPILQKAQLPKWVAYLGFVAAASLFFNLIELLGIDPWTDDHHIRRCPPLLDVQHRSRALEQEDIKQLTTPPNAHS